MRRIFYIFKMALLNMRANRFLTINVIVLLTVSMTLTMLAFGYIRQRDIYMNSEFPPQMDNAIECIIQTDGAAWDAYEDLFELWRDQSAWQSMWAVTTNRALIFTANGYSTTTPYYVDAQTYPDVLLISEGERQNIRQALLSGQAVVGTQLARRLGIGYGEQTLYVDGRTYTPYVSKEWRGDRYLLPMQNLGTQENVSVLVSLYCIPKDGVTQQTLLDMAEQYYNETLSESEWIVRSWSSTTYNDAPSRPTVEFVQKDQSRYIYISLGVLALAALVLFSAVDNKVRSERRDAGIKLSIGAGFGGLVLQQMIEILVCAAFAAVVSMGIVSYVCTFVTGRLYADASLVFDGVVAATGGGLGAAVSLFVAAGALWRMKRMRLRSLLLERM